MADKIVFRYASMTSAVQQIQNIAADYSSAAATFKDAFASATSAWEGDSKVKMQSFIDGAVMEYLGKSIPDIVNALAELLKANVDTMQKTDADIAEQIPQTLGEG